MPSAEQLAFWAAIRANPDDDTPRLVYADWLQENGDEPRAEFIRVQCALARLADDKEHQQARKGLQSREMSLLGRHGHRWVAPMRSVLADTWVLGTQVGKKLEWPTFERGMLVLTVGFEGICRLATTGSSLEPPGGIALVETAQGVDCASRFAQLATWNGYGLITHIGLSGMWSEIGDGTVTSIVHLQLNRIGSLCLRDTAVTDAGASMIANWSSARTLSFLDLSNSPISDHGAAALAASSVFANLQLLFLHATEIGPVGREQLRERFGDRLSIESEPQ